MIVCSAIKFYEKNNQFPRIVCALRHADIFKDLYNKHIDYDRNTAIQGFLTDENRFVNRHEAAKIALQCNQIDKEISELYSEDLWI